MDLRVIIEQMETGEQDKALAVLQSFNIEMSQCFTFNREEGQERKRLGELVLSFLSRELQPSCLLACLETVRILTRDKQCLDPFISRSAMLTLAHYSGIAHLAAPSQGPLEESKVGVVEKDGKEEAEDSSAMVKESSPPSENPDQEVIIEALKSICNILFHSQTAQVIAADLHFIDGVAERLKQCNHPTWNPEVRFFDLRLTFLLTALRVDVRVQLAQELHGIKLLGNQLEATLCLCWPEPMVTARVGYEGFPPEELPPLSRQQAELAMEILKILFNITFNTNRRKVDEGHKLKEALLPSLNLLTESSRIHRETRKFLRSKVLPPLRDVKNRPEVGSALRNKLVRLMTHIDTDVKDCTAEFLFVLCKESVSRFIKYTGYGNAAGLLAARGLLRGGRDSGIYSEDEDSETEEYREAKPHINLITGVVEEEQPNPMEGMTDEQKEYEAMKLVNMFDRLSRINLIQPMQLNSDGKMTEMTTEDLNKLATNPLLQSQEPSDPDSEDET
ncbi:chaperone Ric-8A isoform X2 [Xiphophorus couchianus]|uniref:chaperone Ric-8A isoform X2 n=1 Tax=Xiphophorus couchianus TaxID=32473 RepID=UPI00101633C2|nr:synembryn-A-like isoform X2 [Xiphophorus couchianus]